MRPGYGDAGNSGLTDPHCLLVLADLATASNVFCNIPKRSLYIRLYV